MEGGERSEEAGKSNHIITNELNLHTTSVTQVVTYATAKSSSGV
jgi:hypothetical protein